MPPTKTIATRRKASRSRSEQLKRARQARNLSGVNPGTPEAAPPIPPSADEGSTSSTKVSASKKKLDLFKDNFDAANSSSLHYILCDVSNLQGLFDSLLCSKCKTNSLELQFQQCVNMGMAVKLQLYCMACQDLVAHCNSSSRIPGDGARPYDVNRRAALAFANIGLGHAALASFCEVFAMKPLGVTAHHDTMGKLYEAADLAKEKLLQDTREKVQAAYKDLHIEPDEAGIIDITVSYDGSWPTRGRRSKHGVGCVIDSITGLVVDYEAMSIFCQRCETTGARLKQTDQEQFEKWAEEHQSSCAVNHTGSSGAMEVSAAKVLWGRSLERGFRYTTMISDGDCKTYNELMKMQPYGEELIIKKEECVNHFSKRVGTALRNVVESEKARGITLGGNKKGSLTVKKMTSLQTYFQKAILNNPGSLDAMRDAVWATFYHAVSTDEEPQHQKCPTGEDSWCTFNKAMAQGLPPPPHKSSVLLNERVAKYLKPVYERLTTDELLGRCLQGKTQNANESLHSVVWGFCPKTTFVGAQRVKLALYLGAGQYNCGSLSLQRLMGDFSLECTDRTKMMGSRRDELRVKHAEKGESQMEKGRREKRRAAHMRAQEEIERAEGGPSYAPGGF